MLELNEMTDEEMLEVEGGTNVCDDGGSKKSTGTGFYFYKGKVTSF